MQALQAQGAGGGVWLEVEEGQGREGGVNPAHRRHLSAWASQVHSSSEVTVDFLQNVRGPGSPEIGLLCSGTWGGINTDLG